MKAKQFLYTSWKNGSSPSKGFMIYSMSNGISREDAAFIQNTLKYAPPSNLPYSPTQEEIDKMFPRGFAAFRLPSQKYCIGQSYYIGKDYSGRLGNYIIHAFVFETRPDFLALDLLESDIFKKNLTEEEAEAETNPPALPEIDVFPGAQKISEKDLKDFFVPGKLEILKKFVAAVLRGIQTGKTVYFTDTFPDIDYWFSALRYCLPEAVIRELSFSTFSLTPNASFNVMSLKPGGQFNYRNLLASGEIAFSIKENVTYDKADASGFVDLVVSEFALSPSSAANAAMSINELLPEAGNDLDLAIRLYYFYEGRLDLFKTSDDLMTVAEMAGAEKASVLNALERYANERMSELNTLRDSKLFAYIFENDPSARSVVFKVALKEISNLTPRTEQFSELYKKYAEGSPFNWTELRDFLISQYGSLSAAKDVYKSEFVQYVIMMLASKGSSKDDRDFIAGCMSKTLKEQDIGGFKSINALIRSNKALADITDLIMPKYFDYLAHSGILGNDLGYIFELLDETVGRTKINCLINTIKSTRWDSVKAWPVIGNYCRKNGIDVEEMSELSGNDPDIENFKVFLFQNSAHSDEDLIKFYNEVYLKGKAPAGVFSGAVISYLNSFGDDYEKLVDASIYWNGFATNPRYYLEKKERDDIERETNKTFTARHTDSFTNLYYGKPGSAMKKIDAFIDYFSKRNGDYPPACMAYIIGKQIAAAAKVRSRYEFTAFLNTLTDPGYVAGAEVKKALSKYYSAEVFDVFKKVCEDPNANEAAPFFIRNLFSPLLEADGTAGMFRNPFQDAFIVCMKKQGRKDLETQLVQLLNMTRLEPVKRFLNGFFMTEGMFQAKSYIKALRQNSSLKAAGTKYLEEVEQKRIWKKGLF